MTPYLAMISVRFRLLFQYRAAALAGVCTQIFWGIMHVMVFTALYAELPEGVVPPISLPQTISYVWLVQACLMLLPWNIDPEIEQLVRNGNIVYELIRPIDLYRLLFVRALAWRCAPIPLRVLPILLVAYLFFDMQLPPSITSGVLFLLSIFFSLVLATAITALMMASLFWTLSSNGIVKIVAGFVIIFSGMQMPLPLFPDWFKPVIDLLPFRGLMDTPFRLYLGHIPPESAVGPILHQLCWAAILIACGNRLLVRIQNRLIIQGG